MSKQVFFTEDFHLDLTHIPYQALSVCQKLKQAGHSAYIVGGCVRDLLLNKIPKDFDISTSAKPEEIKALFGRNCILVGRRFRLAHLRYGRDIFEVSTFRGGDPDHDALIIRDNSYGTEEEDVYRRDFTINGLYFDPEENIIIDYVDGISDLNQKLLKSIGDPQKRYIQDPVRMLRMIKFHARLEFSISPLDQQALDTCGDHIFKSSPERLSEEFLRILETTYTHAFFEKLDQFGFLDRLFPPMASFFSIETNKQYFAQFFEGREKHLSKLPRAALFAGLLWPIIEQECIDHKLSIFEDTPLHHIIAANVVQSFVISSFVAFPKKLLSETKQILSNQFHLNKLFHRKTVAHLPHTNLFTPALNLLAVRAYTNKDLKATHQFWIAKAKNPRRRHETPAAS